MSETVIRISKKPLIGQQVLLEFRHPKHAEYIYQVHQCDEFINYLRPGQQLTPDMQLLKQQLEQENSSGPREKTCFDWVISTGGKTPTAQPIGIASLSKYHFYHNRAELFIGIANPEYRKGWQALEATLLIIEFAFNTLKLNRLGSCVHANNVLSQKITLQLGFTQESVLRQFSFNPSTNAYVDMYQNSLLKTEFYESDRLARWSVRLLGRDITRPQWVI